MDRRDQARLIPNDVEYRQIAYPICIWEYLAQVIKRSKFPVLHQPLPVFQSFSTIWMLAGEVIQAFTRDDVH